MCVCVCVCVCVWTRPWRAFGASLETACSCLAATKEMTCTQVDQTGSCLAKRSATPPPHRCCNRPAGARCVAPPALCMSLSSAPLPLLSRICCRGRCLSSFSRPAKDRVSFTELDATAPDWPVDDSAFDIVLMSYISVSPRPAPRPPQAHQNGDTSAQAGQAALLPSCPPARLARSCPQSPPPALKRHQRSSVHRAQ